MHYNENQEGEQVNQSQMEENDMELDLNWKTKKTMRPNDSDIYIAFVRNGKTEKISFTFFSRLFEAIGDEVTYAVSGNRIYFKITKDTGKAYKLQKNHCSLRVRMTISQEEKKELCKFVGNHTLNYSKSYNLWYVEVLG